MPRKQWHPAFVAAIREIVKEAPPEQIEVIPEVALSSKPLDVDVLVVKKSAEVKLTHPIAWFFRRYNLFEYKSPRDYLEPNDYDKGLAVTFLYKA